MACLCVFVVFLCFCGVSVRAQANPEWIRVAVVQGDPEVTLQIHGGFTISALHTGERIRQGSRLQQTEVRAVSKGLALGQTIMPVMGVRVEPTRDATINLNGKRLRGTIEIVRNDKELKLLVVNHVALEDYLQGVLSKEMPHYWPMEALKVVAIAARTYALYQRVTKEQFDYDVTGDVMSQDYGGRSAEKGKTTRAVKATQGIILTDGGLLFPPFYHSTCGGLTEDAITMGAFRIAPLNGKVTCGFCRESPFYQWTQQLTAGDVAWALKQKGRGSFYPVEDVQIIEWTPTGRVAKIRIRSGTGRQVDVSGYEFRQLFGFERMRSTAFTITHVADAFVIQGRGWGHGVGLCQWGASELARRGLAAHEILALYYPTAQLARVGEVTLQPIRLQEGS